MITRRYIVIYYDGNDTKAKLVETPQLPENIKAEEFCREGTITAIIHVPDHMAYIKVHEGEDLRLIIMNHDTCPEPNQAIFVEDI